MKRRAPTALALALFLALGTAPPATGQGSEYGLRPGLWAGEFVAFADLTGSAQGASAVYTGHISGQHDIIVDEEGEISAGGWTLDGAGVMIMTGSVSGEIQQVYVGGGSVDGDVESVTMSGQVSTSGTVTANGRSMSVEGVKNSISLEIPVTRANCAEVEADITFPLEGLAAEAEWTGRDIDGFWYAQFVAPLSEDDTLEVEVFERIDALEQRQEAWADTMLQTGTVDVGEGWTLIAMAQGLAAELADLNPCLFATRPGPDEYILLFTLGMAVDLLDLLQNHEVSGRSLHDASFMIPAFGKLGSFRDLLSFHIQRQGERVLNAEMAADGDVCDPCLAAGGDGDDAAQAALAGHSQGHTFTIDGIEYTPDRIVTAIAVAEGGL